jgi:cell division protein ZapA
MAKSTTCTIRICNKNYQIKCDEDETEVVQLAAQKLSEQMQIKRESFKQLDEYQVLLLAALNLSQELINCQNLQEKKRLQLTEFISALEHKIHQAAEGIIA